MAPSVQEPPDITFDVTALRAVLLRVAAQMVLLHRGMERDAGREHQNLSLPADDRIAQQFAESLQLLRAIEDDIRTLWVKPEPVKPESTQPGAADPGPAVSSAGTQSAPNTAAGGAGGNRTFHCPRCEKIVTVS